MRERSQAKELSARYLEGDDEDEELEQSLLKIKKKYKQELAKGTVKLGREVFCIFKLQFKDSGPGCSKLN